MSTQVTILPPATCDVEWMRAEIEALAAEIFANEYGCDWQRAIDSAFIEVIGMLDYARTWDAECLARREVALMKLTSCSAEDAIDAIRVADGRPVWAEVLA